MQRPLPSRTANGPYVFVSYAHRDEQEVFEEIALLQHHGFEVWYDEGILPTTIWRDEIAAALAGASAMLLYVSEHSRTSRYCLQEVNYAISRGVPVLPIFLRDLELPPGLDLSLGSRQALHRFKYPPDAYLQRLLASVASLMPDAEARPITHIDREAAPSSDRQIAIAVLPLTARGDEAELIADGTTDELIHGLSKVPNLLVAPRSSSFSYKGRALPAKQVCQELGVEALVTGHLDRAGDRVRLMVELVSASDGFTFWSERYRATMKDIFDLQEEIAAQVLDSLRVSLSTSERIALLNVGTRNPLAYELYLKANHERERESLGALERAHQHLADALEEDPEFVEAYYSRFLVHQQKRRLYGVSWEQTESGVERTLAAMRRLDPLRERVDWKEVEEFLESRGVIDMKRYEASTRRALERGEEQRSLPRQAYFFYGEVLSLSDLPTEAIGYYRRFELKNPKDTVVKYSLAYNHAHLGDFASALDCCEQALQIDGGSVRVRGLRACLLSRVGNFAEARRDLAFLEDVWGATNFATFYHAFFQEGPDAAGEQLDWLVAQKIPAAFKGYGRLVLGDVDRAVQHFREDLEAEAAFLINLNRFGRFYTPEDAWQRACESKAFRDVQDALGIGPAWKEELLQRVDALGATTGVGRAS